MAQARPTLLLTRTEAQSKRFAAEFRARFGADFPIVLSPLMTIVQLSPHLPEGEWPDVIFTSENTVRALLPLLPDRSATAWCVGARTERAAAEAGFATRTGPGDASGLCRAIIADGHVTSILYPRPVYAAGAVAETLISAGIETKSIVVYDQQECAPSREALILIAGPEPVLLPLFSPRSAKLAAAAFAKATAPIWIAAISDSAASAGASLPASKRIVASRPDAEAMLDALGELIAAAKVG